MTRVYFWLLAPVALFVVCRLIERSQERRRSWAVRVKQLSHSGPMGGAPRREDAA